MLKVERSPNATNTFSCGKTLVPCLVVITNHCPKILLSTTSRFHFYYFLSLLVMWRPVVIAATVFLLNAPVAMTQGCAAGTARMIHGNWYCSAVKAITYSNFPGKGQYKKVTYMNASTGECSQERYLYSGSLSPLNEEVCIMPPPPDPRASEYGSRIDRGAVLSSSRFISEGRYGSLNLRSMSRLRQRTRNEATTTASMVIIIFIGGIGRFGIYRSRRGRGGRLGM